MSYDQLPPVVTYRRDDKDRSATPKQLRKARKRRTKERMAANAAAQTNRGAEPPTKESGK